MHGDAGECWIYHRGALGDSIMLWPMLRAMVCAGRRVVLVTDRSKALLAAVELGIEGVDAEHRRFNDLWMPDAAIEPVLSASDVLAFIGGQDTESASSAADDAWLTNVRRMFPCAEVRAELGRPDAAFARPWVLPPHGGMPKERTTRDGPIICHIGAGAEAKRWPMEGFAALADALASRGKPGVKFIAGEVEAERLGAAELLLFENLGGRFVFDLFDLAELIRGAGLFLGHDSGPTHLAAQLGVPVLALFGPTCPQRWGPVGPRVMILAPPAPWGMDWLSVERVAAEIERMWLANAPRPAV